MRSDGFIGRNLEEATAMPCNKSHPIPDTLENTGVDEAFLYICGYYICS